METTAPDFNGLRFSPPIYLAKRPLSFAFSLLTTRELPSPPQLGVGERRRVNGDYSLPYTKDPLCIFTNLSLKHSVE
jgi:hypothetical protein